MSTIPVTVLPLIDEKQLLSQIDSNMNHRGWCYIAVLAMIANYYEKAQYKTNDMAYKYMTRQEVEKKPFLGIFEVSNSKYIISDKDTLYNISKLRGYECVQPATNTDVITRIKSTLNNGNLVQLIIGRYKGEIDTDTNKVIYPNNKQGPSLGMHTWLVIGYTNNSLMIADPGSFDKDLNTYISIVPETGISSAFEIQNRQQEVYVIESIIFYNINKYISRNQTVCECPQLSLEGTLAYIFNKFENENYTYKEIYKMIKPEDTFYKYQSRLYGETESTKYFTSVLNLRGYLNGYLIDENSSDKDIIKKWMIYNCNKAIDIIFMHIRKGYIPVIHFSVKNTSNNNLGLYYGAVDIDSLNEDNSFYITGLYNIQERFKLPTGVATFKLNLDNKELIFEPCKMIFVKLIE